MLTYELNYIILCTINVDSITIIYIDKFYLYIIIEVK